MKSKIDLRLDAPGISKFKNRITDATPEINDVIKKSMSDAVVKLIEQNGKSFNQLVLGSLQEAEARGVFKVKEEKKAEVYAINNTMFTPEATVRIAPKKAPVAGAEKPAKAEKAAKPAKEKAAASATAETKDGKEFDL